MSLDEMWMEHRKSPSDSTMGKLKLAYEPLKNRVVRYAGKEIRRRFESGDPNITSAIDSSFAKALKEYNGCSHTEFINHAFNLMFTSVEEQYRRARGRERIRLFVHYRKTKDTTTLHSLVDASRPIVTKIAGGIKQSARNESMDDLVQDGILGFIESLRDSETRNWDSFMRFARTSIRNRIHEGVSERSNSTGGYGQRVLNVPNTTLEAGQRRT